MKQRPSDKTAASAEVNFAAEWERRRNEAASLGVRIRPSSPEDLLRNARRALSGSRSSEGFGRLADLGRLDLSLEALCVDPRFTALFTDSEANTALDRLLSAGYLFRK